MENKIKKTQKKKYTSEDMQKVFDNVIMPQLLFMGTLSYYILFRISLLEGFIALALSILFNIILIKKIGFI